MNFQDILNRLNVLTTFMNNVIANSKKTFQLPTTTAGEKLVAVWNEESQRTEQYNLSELIAYVNSINTRIVNYGTIDRDVNEFTFNVGFEWIIQGLEYANATAVVENIALASTGNNRIDIAVLNAFNGIDVITGFETTGTAEQPLPPPNTILLKIFVVTDSDVEVEDPPAATLIVAEVDGAIISGVNRINIDGATLTDNGNGIITITISGGAVDSVNGQTGVVSIDLQQILNRADRPVGPILDGDTLESINAHYNLLQCSGLSTDTTFIIPVQYIPQDPDYEGENQAELKILNDSDFTITLTPDTDVTINGTFDSYTIPKNAIAILKCLNTFAWSLTFQYADIPSGATDLAYTPSPTQGTVTSSTGTDAIIPLADGTNAGLLSPSFWTLLTNFATNVRSTVLTGLSTSTATAVTATDTILQAIGKLQAQLNNKANKRTLISLSSNKSLTNTTSLQALFDDDFDVEAGEYTFFIEASLASLAASGAIFFGTLGTAGVTSINWVSNGNKQASFPATNQIQVGSVTTAVQICGSSTGTNGIMVVTGRVVFSGSGTFIPAVGFSTAPSSGVVNAGSSGSIIKID